MRAFFWSTGVSAPYNSYDYSESPAGFLNSGVTASETPYCPKDPSVSLVSGGFIAGNAIDPSYTGPTEYVYEVVNDMTNGPQAYVLYTLLEDNTALMQTDGGFCKNIYEAGPGVGIIKPSAAANSMGGCQP